MVKHLPTMWEIWFQSLGRKHPLEKEMATNSTILAWKIPWTEEPGRLQSMGSQRVGHDWVTSLSLWGLLRQVRPGQAHCLFGWTQSQLIGDPTYILKIWLSHNRSAIASYLRGCPHPRRGEYRNLPTPTTQTDLECRIFITQLCVAKQVKRKGDSMRLKEGKKCSRPVQCFNLDWTWIKTNKNYKTHSWVNEENMNENKILNTVMG